MSVFDTRNKGKARGNVTSIVNKKRKKAASRTMIYNVLLCLFVIGMLTGIILSSTQMTELTAQASSLKARNEELLSEQKRLQAMLDMRTNLKEVESIAFDSLYMQKLEQDQIVYLSLTGSDFGRAIEDTRPATQRIMDFIKNAAITLSEYVN